MKTLITGSVGFASATVLQNVNINEIAGVISQLVIAVFTIVKLFKNEKKDPKS